MDEPAAILARWKADPVAFVRENFLVEPDAWQVDALHDYAGHQRLAWKACKGPGKTATLSWCAWHFLALYPDSKIAATSISGDNLADGLWTEMALWQSKSPFLSKRFEWAKTRITCREDPETWWMAARSWSRSADSNQQANTLAGLHAENIMFIIDEAGGVPDGVMSAAEAALATIGGTKRLLIAGNPTDVAGPLYRACTTERELWQLIEITADPDDPKRTPRVSIEWARQQIAKYGKDNPWVLVNVFGKFPPSGLNTLLGPDEVNAAMGKHLSVDIYGDQAKVLGVDVARFGDDKTVIFPRQGRASFTPVEMRNARTRDIVARVAQAFDKWQADIIFVDDTGGYGIGVIDGLTDAGYPVVPVNFSSRALDPRYVNKRAEIYFLLAEWVKSGGVLPTNVELTGELTTPKYWFHKNQFQIEDKDDIKKLLGRSPDLADALALTFAQPVLPRPRDDYGRSMSESHRVLVDFDPMSERSSTGAVEWNA